MLTKYIDVTGRNEEKAVEAALKQLNLARDEVSVEILERAKSGFLGIGATPAKVRVTYQAEEEPATAPVTGQAVETAADFAAQRAPKLDADERPADVEPPEEKGQEPVPAPAAETDAPEEPGEDRKAEKIVDFLTGLMEHMQFKAVPVVSRKEDGLYQVELQGENLGSIIGRRGETLDAIQQLTNVAVNRSFSKRVRIHIDVENYRARREETLTRLAIRVADKVVKYRRNVSLEPMNAYERHIIHAALQDYPGVTTYSTGTEPNRRVIVAWERK